MNLMSEAGQVSNTPTRKRIKDVNGGRNHLHNGLNMEGLLEKETLTDSLNTVLDSSAYGSLLREYETDLESLKRELDWIKEENVPIFELRIKEEKDLNGTNPSVPRRSREKGKKAGKRSGSE